MKNKEKERLYKQITELLDNEGMNSADKQKVYSYCYNTTRKLNLKNKEK